MNISSTQASQRFAGRLQGRITADLDRPGRGVLQAPFVVLHGAQMAAALVEVGFISNPADCGELATTAHRRKLAGAVADARLLTSPKPE